MNRDFFSVLQQKADSFSKGQRLLAQYITESYDIAAFMTASELAGSVGVSESTVVRFATVLGYNGYPAMLKAMQEVVLSKLTSPLNETDVDEQDVVTAVLQADADKLRQTAESVDKAAFEASVGAILQANSIYILGCRAEAPLADFLGYSLNYMFHNVHTVMTSDAAEMLEKLLSVSDKDAVIAFNFPRYASATIQGVQYCRNAGATVIGCTDSSISPLGQFCDHILLTKCSTLVVGDSLVAPLSIANALIVALASERKQALDKTLSALESVWDEHKVFKKRVDER